MTINKKISAFNYSNRNGTAIKYIVIHDTGVKGQTAKNNVDHFAGGDRRASAHYFIDESNIWQSVEEANASWHCGDGDGAYGITNQNSIGIEMCPAASGIPDSTQNLCIELVKTLQAKYGVSNANIVRHYDASRKNCPQYLNLDGKWTAWNTFKSKLEGAVNATTEQGTTASNNITASNQIGSLDSFKQSADFGILEMSGWHHSPKSGKYRFIFLMDYNTNTELARVKSDLIPRLDVKSVYPYAYANTGFAGKIGIASNVFGKKAYIMVRYTDDASGNNPISDYSFRDKAYTIASPTTEYKVKVSIPDLRIRESNNAESKFIKYIEPGIYTIKETVGNWGKLKSDLGWICLDYTTRA